MRVLSNSDAPTVSVVIPLYNKGKYIERALSSVLAQTIQPYEIIVIDDGSTDDGPEKVLNFNNKKIILIRQDNIGPGAARNNGLCVAKGKYVAFLDADDEWMPSFLNEGLLLLEDQTANVTAVSAGFIRSPSNIKNINEIEDLNAGLYEISADTDINLFRKLIIFTTVCFTIMRTSVVRRWGGFFDNYKCTHGEDTSLFIKLILNERIGIITKPLGIYHMESSNLYGGGSIMPVRPEPFIEDPSDILAACHPNKRNMLNEFLSIRTLDYAKQLALWGQRREAKKLLSHIRLRYRSNFKEVLKVRLLSEIAPVIPTIRWLSQNTKLLLNN